LIGRSPENFVCEPGQINMTFLVEFLQIVEFGEGSHLALDLSPSGLSLTHSGRIGWCQDNGNRSNQ